MVMSCSAAGTKRTVLLIFKSFHIYDEWTALEENLENPEFAYAASKKN